MPLFASGNRRRTWLNPSQREIAAGLVFVDALDSTEQSAFLALFAGAVREWHVYEGDDSSPFIGKHECEMVDDWRDFYGRRLVDAGLFAFTEGERFPALGMTKKPDGTHPWGVKIAASPTTLGWDVREAWWARWRQQVDARMESDD